MNCRVFQSAVHIIRRPLCSLTKCLNATPLCIPFVQIVHTLAMCEFGDDAYINGNTLRDDGDVQSTTKQKEPRLTPFFSLSFK
jgi:hypothetical protein